MLCCHTQRYSSPSQYRGEEIGARTFGDIIRDDHIEFTSNLKSKTRRNAKHAQDRFRDGTKWYLET